MIFAGRPLWHIVVDHFFWGNLYSQYCFVEASVQAHGTYTYAASVISLVQRVCISLACERRTLSQIVHTA